MALTTRSVCALMSDVDVFLHPGPPIGPEFEGLSRLCFIPREREKSALCQPNSGVEIPLSELFDTADNTFGCHIGGVHVFVTGIGDWCIVNSST